jgi:hypothetical protein
MKILSAMSLAWALTLSLPASAVPPSASLGTLAKQFFQEHELFWTEVPSQDIYSPEFERLLRLNSDCVSAGESCAIDWDFWSSGQDRGELRFERVVRVIADGKHRVVEVAYKCDCGSGRASRLTAMIIFVQIENDWRVDDVRRGKASAREALSRYFSAR